MKEIQLSGTQNTRFISNCVIRSDRIDKISESDKDILILLGADTIVDLRKEKDRKSSVISDQRFEYHYCTLEIESWEEISKKYTDLSDDEILIEEYLGYCSQYEVMRDIFCVVIEATGKILIMCHYGKDRTGVVSALIELLVERNHSEIIEDYYLSSQNTKSEADDNKFANLKSNKIIMEKFLDKFLAKYGTIEKYLKQGGLSNVEISKLKSRVLREF